MPRFFFNVHDGVSIADTVGSEPPDVDSARSEAVDTIAERLAEAVARDMNISSRSLTMGEATEVFGPFGALMQSASSRLHDTNTRQELGWTPTHLDMLSMIGEPRLRALAQPSLNQENDLGRTCSCIPSLQWRDRTPVAKYR